MDMEFEGFYFSGPSKKGRKPSDSTGTGRKLGVYLRVDVLAALHEQSERLGKSVSWCLNECARHSMEYLKSLDPKDAE